MRRIGQVSLAAAAVAGVAVTAIQVGGAQPDRNPRQPPDATMRVYAPDQHDLYDGRVVMEMTWK